MRWPTRSKMTCGDIFMINLFLKDLTEFTVAWLESTDGERVTDNITQAKYLVEAHVNSINAFLNDNELDCLGPNQKGDVESTIITFFLDSDKVVNDEIDDVLIWECDSVEALHVSEPYHRTVTA